MVAKLAILVLGGGCFWGVQDLVRKIPGVVKTEVGYTGGAFPNPRYEDVKKGITGHAESVRIEYDPSKVSLDTLLSAFFRLHDPTTPNQQGNDKGSQYRSVIFYSTDAEKKEIEAKIKAVDASHKWKKPVVTEVKPLQTFYSAEDYHQDYLVKNPGGYTCHYYRD